MNVGDVSPGFELPASDGSTVSLESFRGKKSVVLCFYPKNHLFACPSKMAFKMARSVIAAHPEIASLDAVLFAISVDTVESQKEFVEKYDVPYLHLSNTSRNTCKRYAGLNLVRLAKRSTFVIDAEGRIAKIFREIDVENHGRQIVDFLKGN